MILGHTAQIQYLKKILKEGNVPHALLFCGPEKVGKKQVAFEFCSMILGENFKTHPDFLLIEGENTIQIDQIRNLIFKFSLKPIKSNWQIAVLDNAHLMTREAQQSFLKTLEEPKTNAIFILITAYPSLLLPTILSRCQRINFYPLSKEEIYEFLKKANNLSEEEKETIAEISAGRPGILFDLISKPEKMKTLSSLKKLPQLPIYKRFQLVKQITENEREKEFLKEAINYFRYLFLSKIKGKEIENFPYSLAKIKEILEAIQSTFFLLLTTNVNKRLALEILMLNI
jgi:DNA polymerase-3 subunit delta'